MRSIINRLAWLLGYGRYRQERAIPYVTGPKVVTNGKGKVKYRLRYADGFVCEAWTAKEADKKHRIWWEKVGSKKGCRV